MAENRSEIESTLKRTEDIFQTAKQGYEDLCGQDKGRRFTGLRNFIVFGRSVTFVLQNLKSIVGDSAFEAWYRPKQEEMKADPLMKYFVEARNEILKQGRLNVTTSTSIQNFSTSDLKKFGTPPPGTKGFFIGDQAGGSGWEVELPDGSTEKYYVELPASIGEVKQHFAGLPEAKAPELKEKSVEELCAIYLSRLESLVDNARNYFLGESVQRINGRQIPTYLRVIK